MDGKLPTPTFQRLLSQNSKRRLQYQLSEAITPFVSSTFIDFEEEREYLVKKIFPQLNFLCTEKGSRFDPLDLRWGINEAQKEKGYLIQSCLDYVRHCSPYFICLIGERYGSHRDPKSDLLPKSLEDLGDNPNWLDKNLVVAAVTGNYSFILNNTDNHFASITELEITYRLTLQNPEKMFFYIRDPIDFNQFPESERAARQKKFGSEGEYAAARLKSLKRKIRSYVSDSQIRTYSTVEQLGQQVFDDWSEIIRNEFFDVSTSLRGAAMEMYQEWQAHAAHQQSLGDDLRYYSSLNSLIAISVDQQIEELFFKVSNGFPSSASLDMYKDCLSLLNQTTLAHYKQEKGSIIVVRGARGCGKSAFLAYLSKKRSDLRKTLFCAGVKVFFHFVGCNSQSEDLANFMTRYIDEMTEFFMDSVPARDEQKCLIDSFHAAMCFGPSVIFLDGMDQFTSSPQFSVKEVKDCKWLPDVLPPGCLLIISTTPHDHSHRALDSPKRTDTTFLDLKTPETAVDKNEILCCHFGPRKKLEERQKQLIIQCDLSTSPVFLAALAKELQLCGGYMSVDRQVEKYVSCSNLRTLWNLVIIRWAKDYGWAPVTATPTSTSHSRSGKRSKEENSNEKWTNKNNWVIDALRLLAVSRNGLSQEDLMQCLRAIGYHGDRCSIGTFDFMQFRACSQEAVLARRNGLLYIKHSVMKEAVLYFFLNGVCPEMTTVAPESVFTQPGSARWISTRLKFQNVISDYLLAQPNYMWKEKPYLLEELLWQLRNTGNLSKLVKVLTTPEIFTVIMSSVDKCGTHLLADVRNYWQHVLEPAYNTGHEYIQMVELLEEKVEADAQGVQPASMAASNVKVTEKPPDVIPFIVTPVEQPDTDSSLVDRSLAMVANGPHSVEPDRGDISVKGSSTAAEDRNLVESLINFDEMGRSKDVDSTSGSPSSSFTVSHQPPAAMSLSKQEWLSTVFTQVASFLQHMQLHPEAEFVYKKALHHQSSFTEYSAEETSQLRYIECVLAIGVACARQAHNKPHKLLESRDWLNKALETATLLNMVCAGESISATLQLFKGKILVELIEMSIEQGDLDDARQHLETIESEELLPPTETAFLRKSFCKAIILHKQLLFEESGLEFEKVLKMYTNRFGPNHENLADVLIAYANLLADKNNFDGFNYFTAEDYYQRALSLKQKHLGANHLEVAVVKEKLARHMLTNQKLNSSQLDAYQHLLDAIDIRKIILGPEKQHTAALQNYINENCKSLKRLNNKVRTGAQVDNFLDEQLTIPPIATVEYSSSTRLKSATAAAQSQKTTTSRQLRPASSLSWNDRDLIYLQQRKRKSARKQVKQQRDANLSRPITAKTAPLATESAAAPNRDRRLSASFNELPVISGRETPPTAPVVLTSKLSRSQSMQQNLNYMRRHKKACDIPDRFAVNVSNSRSVHGPNSTLNSLITERIPVARKLNRNYSSVSRLSRKALITVPQESDFELQDGEEDDEQEGFFPADTDRSQFLSRSIFLPTTNMGAS